MTSMQILLLTGGIMGLIFLVLSGAVIQQRAKTKTMLGDGEGLPGKESLQVAVRRHGNFAEYVPLNLLLLSGLVNAGAGPHFIGGLCLILIVARICHPLGLGRRAPNALRVVGTIGTFLVLLVASVTLILDVV